MSVDRADPFAGLDDLSDFEQKPSARRTIPLAEVREASEKQGFVSRPAQNSAPPPSPAPAVRGRRRRSHYDAQLNIKLAKETADRFALLSDDLGWSYAKVLEAAMDALDEARKKGINRPRRS